MRRAKNRNNNTGRQEDGKKNQRCELCGDYDYATAGKMIRGKVKFVCYRCYMGGR